MHAPGKVAGKPTTLRLANRLVVNVAAEVDSSGDCCVYDLAREMASRFATHHTDKVAGLLYLLHTTQLPTYDEKVSAEDVLRQCFHVLPFERKVELLYDFPYWGAEKQWGPTLGQLMQWPEPNPEYVHI